MDLPRSIPFRDQAEHILPVRTYLKVYGALVIFTWLTVQVSLLNLGAAAIYVAMVVATVKALLVVGYFMHLKFGARFHALIFMSSLLFLGIFFVLTMIDLGSRDSVLDEEGNFALSTEAAQASTPPVAPAPSASSP